MENNDFRISIKTVWVLVIGNILLTIIGATTKILHLEISLVLINAGLLVSFSTWIIVISDIAKNKIYNKTFWVMSTLILPSISPIFYLMRRDKLIKIASRA